MSKPSAAYKKKKANIEDLTPTERLLCELRAEGMSIEKACKMAGVSPHKYYKLRHTDGYKQYERQIEANRKMQALKKYQVSEGEIDINSPAKAFQPLLPLAFAVLEQALTEVSLPMRLRLDAAREVLDRAGLGKTQKVSVKRQFTLPESLKGLAKRIAKDREAQLSEDNIIDVTPEESEDYDFDS